MSTVVFHSTSQEETRRIGGYLAQCLVPSLTIGLIGTLGSGKTTLVRAIAEYLGVDPRDVVSPTFTLCQSYPTPSLVLVHIDLYRINSAHEAWQLGWDEIIAEPSVKLIEWADRFPEILPPHRIAARLEVEENRRTITFCASTRDATLDGFLDCLRRSNSGPACT